MLETPHVVVGTVLATKIGNPALAIPIAFLSHFVLEKVPHWNPHLNTEKKMYGRPTNKTTLIVAVDVLTSLTLGGFIASRALPNTALAITILLSGLFSVLPDLIEGPYFFLGQESKFIQKWIAWQKSIQSDTTLIPGLLTQFATIITAFLWLNS